MVVRILPMNVRDLTYIGANMRPADAAEISCQIPPGMKLGDFAFRLHQGLAEGWSWIAELEGQPVCAFGFQPLSTPVWTGWAFGTKKMLRAVPAMTRHCLAQEQRLLDAGVRRLEVRTMKGHDLSTRWLRHLGCTWRAELEDHGNNGEPFELWAWTITDGLPSQRKDYRSVHAQSA